MKLFRLSYVATLLAVACLSCSGADPATIAFADAIAHGDLEKAADLLEQGADINHRYRESDGYTMLMAASGSTDDSPVVPFLLEHSADPLVAAPNGKTAVHLGALNGRLGNVKRLLAAGADPLAKDRKGKTAADYAQERGHAEIARVLSGGGAV
jgi:ankyrin repeat protein